MARMNISIPEELRQQMNAMSDRNWSDIARSAFDREVRKSKNIEVQDKDAIVARLKAEHEEHQQYEVEAGHRDGAEWAAKMAGLAELRFISDCDSHSADVLFDWNVDETCLKGHHRQEFWDIAAGREVDEISKAYVEGFVQGVTELWKSVRPQFSAL